MEKFYKGEYGALETRGGQILQFVNSDTGKRASIRDFFKVFPTEESTHVKNKGIWFFSESSLPTVGLFGSKRRI